jgi:transcriptional regulator with XRE-family HTH domain
MIDLIKLKEARLKSGLSQAALAKKVGIVSSFYNAIELGRKEPSNSVLDAILQALGLSIGDIWDNSDDSLPPIALRKGIIIERNTNTVRYMLPYVSLVSAFVLILRFVL